MPKFLLLLGMVLISYGVPAEENIAMVLAARGDVQIIKNSEAQPLKQGDFVSVGDGVLSGQRSFALLQFFDGGKLSIRPESSVKIIRFDMAMDTGGEALLELTRGSIKLAAGSIVIESKDGFRIQTPFSVMAVRDAEATLGLCADAVCEQNGLEELPKP
jgi:hypothetical protein